MEGVCLALEAGGLITALWVHRPAKRPGFLGRIPALVEGILDSFNKQKASLQDRECDQALSQAKWTLDYGNWLGTEK